jgi:hypothetical protein
VTDGRAAATARSRAAVAAFSHRFTEPASNANGVGGTSVQSGPAAGSTAFSVASVASSTRPEGGRTFAGFPATAGSAAA